MRFFYIIILSIVLFSCEKEANWVYNNDYKSLLVVDGIITNEPKSHLIKLSRTTLEKNTIFATGATLTITNGTVTDVLEEIPANSGHYYTDSNFIAVAGEEYLLSITYQERLFTAKSYLLPVTDFSKLSYSYDYVNDNYHIDWVADVYNAENPAMYEINIDWSSVTGYENENPENCKAKLFYYSLPSLDVNQIFTTNKEIIYFPKGSLITESKYSLTPEHSDFIRSMLSETTWRGGFFDSFQSNVKTNLSFGATGYFGASSVIRKSFIVN